MNPFARRLPKFLLFALLITLVAAVLWEVLFPGRIYHCTDDTGLGYLKPGDWVHGEVESVDRIDPNRSMDQPDSIRRGWTTTGLWASWIGMLGSTVALSWWLSGAGERRSLPQEPAPTK